MDKLSACLNNFLRLAHSSALLVSDGDKANIDVLLTMLGQVDKEILEAYYGLLGTPVMSPSLIAEKYGVTEAAIEEIVAKDIRRLSITPEWQMVAGQLSVVVKKRIGFEI